VVEEVAARAWRFTWSWLRS